MRGITTEKDDVTIDRALKQAVRERAAATGEKYTAARRAVLAEAAGAEFDRQVATLVERGYPTAARLSRRALLAKLEALREPAAALAAGADFEAGRFGFAIVVSGSVVPAARAITLVRRRERPAILSMLEPGELERFVPIEGAAPSHPEFHLIADIDTGPGSRNATPDAALDAIRAAGRSPLTVEEGIAIATQFPEAVGTQWRVLLGGLALPGPARDRVVDQQGSAEARLVLGGQPAHVAGNRILRPAARTFVIADRSRPQPSGASRT